MKTLITLLLFSWLFSVPAYAISAETTAELESSLGVAAAEESLPRNVREINGELRTDGSYDISSALSRLWKALLAALRAQWEQSFSTAAALMLMGLLCALAASVCAQRQMDEFISMAACGAAAALCIGGLDGLVGDFVAALTRISDYSRAVMPALFTAAAVCGGVASAPAKYAAACLAMDVLITAAQELVIPLIRAFLALSVGASLFPGALVSSAARFTKWLAATVMSALTFVFGAYIVLTGLITGTADALAVKTARTVISTALPVVGGILADASAAILSAAALIKNSVGVFALIAVCALCLAPIAAAGLRLLLFKAVAAVCSLSGVERFSRLIGDIGTAMGLLLGLLGCCAAMLFISITAAVKTVGV